MNFAKSHAINIYDRVRSHDHHKLSTNLYDVVRSHATNLYNVVRSHATNLYD